MKNKKILILVTASIAIYKTLDLISQLKKIGAEIFVVMSEESKQFIAPICFEAMSGNPVLCEHSQNHANNLNHIGYANLADIALLAPASVNSIAKLAHGIADNLIVETLLAAKCPILIAPSANVNMIESTQNERNLAILRDFGYQIIPPRTTLLACGIIANGAMAEVSELIFALQKTFLSDCFWQKRKITITGGGSAELIDSVRCISNLSSGKQSANLALAFYLLGAEVTFISSKFPIALPQGIKCIRVQSSEDFYKELKKEKIDILLMCAAISDYIPESAPKTKLKKEMLGEKWNLILNKNRDILSEIKANFKVGFKAECDIKTAKDSAKKMLLSPKNGGKGCDLVILNIVDSSFGSDENEISIFGKCFEQKIGRKNKFDLSFDIASAIKSNVK